MFGPHFDVKLKHSGQKISNIQPYENYQNLLFFWSGSFEKINSFLHIKLLHNVGYEQIKCVETKSNN